MKWLTTILICCVLALTGLGLVMLYSCSMSMEVRKTAVGAKLLISQLTWCAVGLALGAAIACMDYRRLKTISPYLLIVAGFLLLVVFSPYGFGTKGARRWVAIPGVPRFQPSELAKLSLVLFLAAYCDRFQRQMHTFKQGIVIPSCIIAMVLALIFIEPDRGCTILLALVSAAMLVIAGVRWKFIIPPVVAAALALAFSLVHDPMRLRRILAWLHPEENKEGVGYQAYEAMLALGSGGWFGLGLGNGRQKLGFVPEHHTDFIFSIIGEELGIIATLAVVILFIAIIVCATFIAKRSCDTFGVLLGLGITFMIGFQAFINIGVVTSTLPNKGMPLPFISYGGSNLLLMLVATGLLLSISRFAVEPVRKRRNPFEIPTAELSDA
ncbi:MAG: putative lipid II flippase FtsW [Limisphaerales bacterium]